MNGIGNEGPVGELQPLRDPGLQPERTALAWNRTSMLLVANAGLALRSGIANNQRLIICLGAILLVTAAAMMRFGAVRKKQLLEQEVALAPSTKMMLSATVFALFACATAILILT